MKIISLTALFILWTTILFSQASRSLLVDSKKIIQHAEEIPRPNLINPVFIADHNVKSITINFEKGQIGLNHPQSERAKNGYADCSKLSFNSVGELENQYFIKKGENPDTLRAYSYYYDEKERLTARTEETKTQPLLKHIYNYHLNQLQDITVLDGHGETGNQIKFSRNKHDKLLIREEYVDNIRMQAEYFYPTDIEIEELEYIKETEIENATANILIIYLSSKGLLKKELYHTTFSDYAKRYTYDRKGKIVAISQNEYGRTVTQVFKYDTVGNLTEYTQASTGSPTSKITYAYDAGGVFLESISRMVDGELVDRAVLVYGFRY